MLWGWMLGGPTPSPALAQAVDVGASHSSFLRLGSLLYEISIKKHISVFYAHVCIHTDMHRHTRVYSIHMYRRVCTLILHACRHNAHVCTRVYVDRSPRVIGRIRWNVLWQGLELGSVLCC